MAGGQTQPEGARHGVEGGVAGTEAEIGPASEVTITARQLQAVHDRDAREMRVGDEANRGLRSEQCVENCGDAVDPAPVSKRLGATAMSALRKERRRPEVPVPRCGVVAVLHRAAVVDEGSAGIEGRQFVALP